MKNAALPKISLTLSALLVLGSGSIRPAAARIDTRFTLQELGTLGGRSSDAWGVNNAGQVVGWANPAGGNARHAFVWDSTRGMRDLGTLPGGTNSEAHAISNQGEVVGWSEARGVATLHAFLWDSLHGMRDLGTLGGVSSQAYAINENGQVVGRADTRGRAHHAFLWDNIHGMRDLGTFGGLRNSIARSINVLGQVVGYSNVSDTFANRASTWEERSGFRPLPGLGGSEWFAYAVNVGGQVAGYSFTPGNVSAHACFWEREQVIDLGTLVGPNSLAYAINDSGWVVGYSDIPLIDFSPLPAPPEFGRRSTVGIRQPRRGANRAGFIWTAGNMENLNDKLVGFSRWWCLEAHVINQIGSSFMIAGTGLDTFDGVTQHAVVLRQASP